MSIEQPTDEVEFEEAQRQIHDLFEEVREISRSDVEASQFYQAFLSRAVQALFASGGAVWTLDGNGELTLAHQINLEQTGLAESEEHQLQHWRLLKKLTGGGPPMVVGPQSLDGDQQAGNPTDCLLLLGPLKSDQQIEGVLEIFQRPDMNPSTQRGQLAFLLKMCALADDFLKVRRLRHFDQRQSLWSRLEHFARSAHQSLDPRAVAYTVANEGRRLIECDRVTVAIYKRTHCNIEAVSGQETLDKRSNTVALLGKLSAAVCATGDEVWYTGDASNLAPQVEETLQAYIDDSHSKTVAILPLRRPVEDENDREALPQPVIGALIVEQIEESRLPDGFRQRVAVVAEHSSTALANALEHNDLFLMPLWRTLGKARWVVRARTLPWTIAIAGGILAAIAILCIFPADFELQGKGTLEPVDKRDIFARLNGTVREILVDHGPVEAGQPLLTVYSTDVKQELERLEGDRNAKLQEKEAKLRSARDRSNDRDQKQLVGEAQALESQIRSLSRQIELVRDEKDSYSTLRSPIAGHILTWQAREKLDNRPVEKGQVLMTVADLNADWELEIRLPEERMGYLTEAQQQLKSGEQLKVTFIMATQPGTKHEGRVKDIERIAEVHGDDGNVVLVRVKIDKNDLGAEIRPGAGVTAKFYCGRRALGFVWFHDVIAFVQSKILFRL